MMEIMTHQAFGTPLLGSAAIPGGLFNRAIARLKGTRNGRL
ncbi:hypothetical protein BH11VER1_BH11VER1_03680 [soil metagenome]